MLHAEEWISRDPESGAREGETDFIICNRNGGLLVIEVKGGGISIEEGGGWRSLDRYGVRHEIKNPFHQARLQKAELKASLSATSAWTLGGLNRVTIGYAVFLPDVEDIRPLEGPHSPIALIGCSRDSNRLEQWIKGAVGYWAGRRPGAPLGSKGISIVESLYSKVIEIRPVLATSLREEEEERVTLTRQQSLVLQFLGNRTRAKIRGGAGTGKTLLAIEKAQRLADSGQRTLFLCYNHLLAEHVRRSVAAVPNLTVQDFHQMCKWGIDTAKNIGTDVLSNVERKFPGADKFEKIFPESLVEASEVVRTRYDAIVVDEGQDFRELYWFALELYLRDSSGGTLYVFYDENQVYLRSKLLSHSGCPVLSNRKLSKYALYPRRGLPILFR